MAKNKWMEQLYKLEGVSREHRNPFADVVRTPSPSVNFTFGKSHGLPRGYTLVTFGPPKCGKTTLLFMMIGQLHRDDPDAIAVIWDTEFRYEGQLSEADCIKWGIDPDRVIVICTNTAAGVFDRFEKDIGKMVQDGAPIKFAAIDSINGIQGRRSLNAKSIDVQQRGDHALTIQEGLKRILPVQRAGKIALYLSTHVRAEMDETEVMRGNTQRMAASFGLQHHCEYFMYIAPRLAVADRKDFFEQEFVDESKKDLADKAERTAHKIRCVMRANSMAPAGRAGEFTLDYQRGIINTFEEVFWLAVNRGVVERPNNRKYVFGGREWDGKDAFAIALRDEPEIAQKILQKLKDDDLKGLIVPTDEDKKYEDAVAAG